MTVSICACGHPWPSHALRKWGPDVTAQLKLAGETVCSYCECHGYVDAVEVIDRYPFRATQKQPSGNFGVGHPLVVALTKTTETVAWHKLECADCGVVLSSDQALVLDSGFYCGPCFLSHPEVYLGHGGEAA